MKAQWHPSVKIQRKVFFFLQLSQKWMQQVSTKGFIGTQHSRKILTKHLQCVNIRYSQPRDFISNSDCNYIESSCCRFGQPKLFFLNGFTPKMATSLLILISPSSPVLLCEHMQMHSIKRVRRWITTGVSLMTLSALFTAHSKINESSTTATYGYIPWNPNLLWLQMVSLPTYMA